MSERIKSRCDEGWMNFKMEEEYIEMVYRGK